MTASLRTQIAEHPPLTALGVGTPLEAVIAESVGARLLYVSGYATAAWTSAYPDIGLIGLAEIADTAARICRRVGLPVIVDADTGYGDVPQVHETVRRLESCGAAGVQLEDQVWPKRCGHMDGKRVVSMETMTRKVEAAAQARRGDLLIIARTDARQPEGLHDAIRRCEMYAQHGADVLFVDAPESVDELQTIARELPRPLLVNMSETGKTPLLSVRELGDLGFSIVLFATTGVRTAAQAIRKAFMQLVTRGDARELLDGQMSLDDLNAQVGIDELRELERALERAGG